jgi:hypothetical protein
MGEPNRLTPKISLHSDCKTAQVYMGIDPDGRFVLYGEERKKTLDACIEIIENLWDAKCDGSQNTATCESCQAYSRAIEAIRAIAEVVK